MPYLCRSTSGGIRERQRGGQTVESLSIGYEPESQVMSQIFVIFVFRHFILEQDDDRGKTAPAITAASRGTAMLPAAAAIVGISHHRGRPQTSPATKGQQQAGEQHE